ncbi:FG-GAP repeat protein, partial [Streptomyces canarius]
MPPTRRSAAGPRRVPSRSSTAAPPGRTAARTLITQNTAGVPGTAEAGSAFGSAVASADLDKDGYADLLGRRARRGRRRRHQRRHGGRRLGR